MSALTEDITALIRLYVSYSEGMNFTGKKAMWDADDPAPLLMPEEAHSPMVGWDAINTYWSKSRVIMESLKSQTANHHAREIESGIAIATYDMRWIATMTGPKDTPKKPLSADVRVTALLRKKPEGWRIFHLMDGPLDLMSMARKAYSQKARDLFPEHTP